MEEETDRVTLHGIWASSYSKRVEMALKIKGMPYEDVEGSVWERGSTCVLKKFEFFFLAKI